MTAKRKPLKHSGFYTDSGGKIKSLTKGQVRKIALEHVKRLNNMCEKTKYNYRYKLIAVTDHDTHWNYTIQ